MAIQIWPKTNTSSDWASVDGIVWSENQAANTVNDSARAMGRDIAEWHGDTNATLSTGGSSNAYTLTTNGSYTSLANGFCVVVKANHTNTGAATLNVDSLGAKAIRKFSGSGESALVANDIVNGGHYILQYNTAANSAAGGWIVLNPNQVATGDIADSAVTTAKIADLNVTTAKIAANNVTAAKIERNSNTGFVLRSNGSGSDPSWVGGMTRLNSGTASAASTLDITLTSGYRRYIIELGPGFVCNTSGSVPGMRFSYDSGSSFQATNYSWAALFTSTAAAASTGGYSSADSGAWTTTGIGLSAFVGNTSTTAASSFYVEITQGSASLNSAMFWRSFILNSAGAVNGLTVGYGNHSTNDVIDAIRIAANTGTITGQWTLYGVT